MKNNLNFKTVDANCTLCKDSQLNILFEKNSFKYVKCENCNLVFASPRLTVDEINRIYKIGFKGKLEKKKDESDQSKYASIVKSFDKYRLNNRILDIGCFYGTFLKAANDFDWKIYGTEISEDIISHAKENTNGDIRLGELEDIHFEENYFDVIVMMDVIEHLPDPLSTLKEINRILRPGGLLYFDTPNFDSLERRVIGKNLHTIFPWHFYFFNVETISKLLKNSNFSLESCYTSGIGTFSKYDPLNDLNNNANISKKTSSILNFKRNLKKSRLIVSIYRSFKQIFEVVFYLMSKLGLRIGAHLIVNAKKNENL
tara:strand:- start:747 stop:1688 length:942 start_codon:yes stop_codon:yes gene_type:complete